MKRKRRKRGEERKRNLERRAGMFQSPEWERSLMHAGTWHQGARGESRWKVRSWKKPLTSQIQIAAPILGQLEGFNQ